MNTSQVPEYEYIGSDNLNKYETILHGVFPVSRNISKYARYWLYGAIGTLAVITIIMMSVWFICYKEGLGLDVNSTLFNYHPLLMTLGLFLFPIHAMLAYRFVPKSKLIQKIIHSSLMFIGLVIAVGGLIIVEVCLANGKQYHFWSLHSWCGVITIAIYIMQFVVALVSFFLPIRPEWKGKVLVIHKYTGILLIFLPMTTILLGASQLTYTADATGEAILGRFVGVCVIILAVLISVSVIGPLRGVIPKVTRHENLKGYEEIN